MARNVVNITSFFYTIIFQQCRPRVVDKTVSGEHTLCIWSNDTLVSAAIVHHLVDAGVQNHPAMNQVVNSLITKYITYLSACLNSCFKVHASPNATSPTIVIEIRPGIEAQHGIGRRSNTRLALGFLTVIKPLGDCPRITIVARK